MTDSADWNRRYKEKLTGWDVGYITPPIKDYLDQVKNKEIRILIPGAGYGYEAAYAYESGFKETYICEWSEIAVNEFQKLNPKFPKSHIIAGDFFDINMTFDLIIEQTFFCALNPELRNQYASKVYTLLHPGGKLAGVLFNFHLTAVGPPYGGSVAEYFSIFTQLFDILCLEECYNSISPRKGSELFIILKKQMIK